MTPGVVYLQQGMLAAGFGSRPGDMAIIWVLGIMVALALVLLVALVVTCLLEKQHLAGHMEPTQPPYPCTPTRYWEITRANAMTYGLQHAGDYATKKSLTLVRGLESLFFTPDRLILVSIVSGSAAGVKLKRTVLRTRMADGGVLESTDHPGMEDFSGGIERELLINAGVEELLALHGQRLRRAGRQALVFGADARVESDRMHLERGQRWVQQGYAHWVNPEQTVLRMTLKGALAHFRGTARQMRKVSAQRERSGMGRAG